MWFKLLLDSFSSYCVYKVEHWLPACPAFFGWKHDITKRGYHNAVLILSGCWVCLSHAVEFLCLSEAGPEVGAGQPCTSDSCYVVALYWRPSLIPDRHRSIINHYDKWPPATSWLKNCVCLCSCIYLCLVVTLRSSVSPPLACLFGTSSLATFMVLTFRSPIPACLPRDHLRPRSNHIPPPTDCPASSSK